MVRANPEQEESQQKERNKRAILSSRGHIIPPSGTPAIVVGQGSEHYRETQAKGKRFPGKVKSAQKGAAISIAQRRAGCRESEASSGARWCLGSGIRVRPAQHLFGGRGPKTRSSRDALNPEPTSLKLPENAAAAFLPSKRESPGADPARPLLWDFGFGGVGRWGLGLGFRV